MPWCHSCEKEYKNRDVCPVCGRALRDETPPALMDKAKPVWSGGKGGALKWPLLENGTPVGAAYLTTVGGSQVDYDMTLSLLRAYGIPARCDYPDAGQFIKLVFGFSSTGMDVYVPETMLEDAKNILGPADEVLE